MMIFYIHPVGFPLKKAQVLLIPLMTANLYDGQRMLEWVWEITYSTVPTSSL